MRHEDRLYLVSGNTRDRPLTAQTGLTALLTQNSAAVALGRGSCPSSTLSVNVKKDIKHSLCRGCSRTPASLAKSRETRSMPFCASSGSASGTVIVNHYVRENWSHWRFYLPGSAQRSPTDQSMRPVMMLCHPGSWGGFELTKEHAALTRAPILGVESVCCVR